MKRPFSSHYSDNYFQYQFFHLSTKLKEQRMSHYVPKICIALFPMSNRNSKKRSHTKRILKKHFLGYYPFKSKTLLDKLSPEGWCKAAMYALLVKEELESWPEKSHRQRSWLTIPKAVECCRHAWTREALEKGFWNWYADGMIHTLPIKDVPKSSSNNC